MDFSSAEQERRRIRMQFEAGQMTEQEYFTALNDLRVTDESGRWWQPDHGGSGWLVWNGGGWEPGTLPGTTVSVTQPAGAPKNMVEFQSRLMTIDEFKKMSKEVPISKRPQKWWDLLSILGGIVSAVLWLLYSGNPWGEGIDLITAILMAGLPIFTIWFREDLDVALLPLQQYRKDVNRLLLVGIGMAFPFLTSFILFNLDIREYALMQYNLIIGTFGAYVITRNPVIRLPGTGSHSDPGRPPAAATNAILAILLAVICYLFVLPVRADDCTRNILNAQDCDRTEGFAEVISGTPPAVIAGLINGKGIHDTLTSGGSGGGQSVPTAPSSGSAAQVAGQAQTSGTSAVHTGSITDHASTFSQASGQTPIAGTTSVHTGGSVSDHASTLGQASGQTPAAGSSSVPTGSGAGHGSSMGSVTGQGQTAGSSVPAGSSAGPSGSAGTVAGPGQGGPDSLPVSPDDVQNIKEAIEDMHNEEEEIGVAAAAAFVTAESSEAADTAHSLQGARSDSSLIGGKDSATGTSALVGKMDRQYCHHCGALLKPGQKYCHNCGKDSTSGFAAIVDKVDRQYCHHCGALLKPGQKYCHTCGTLVP
jgi:RNA polymerase subunit RPABC4/transcription elongation factor Spt4